MLVVRYSKSGGAEFISHLDTLRHLQKTVIRAGINVEYSQGFNPHMLIYMSSPIGAGLISYAEYFVILTDESAGSFREKFNANCPLGFCCEEAFYVYKNPNLAAVVDGAEYRLEGVPERVDVDGILSAEEFFVTDKKGERKNVRDKIKDLRFEGGSLYCKLDSGNSPLRADLFAAELEQRYSFVVGDIIKTESFIGWRNVKEAIKSAQRK